MSLELGGKNPSIVFPDAADDDLIANLLLSSRVHRQGKLHRRIEAVPARGHLRRCATTSLPRWTPR